MVESHRVRCENAAEARRIAAAGWARAISAESPLAMPHARPFLVLTPCVARGRGCRRLGLRPATGTVVDPLVGTVGHIHAFRRARQFASWLGLTPREYSSGQRRRLGGISKRGDVYLRCLLTHGARAVLASAHRRRAAQQPLTRLHHWAMTVHARRGYNKATIAVANKLGRLVWAVWHKDVPCALPDAA